MNKDDQKQKQINLRVKDEDQFYSNEISINFNPSEIIFDFKCITHMHDVAEHRSMLIRHLPIIITPFHAKSLLGMLNNAIKDYEEKFGEIKKPEALKKAEKMMKKYEKEKPDSQIKDLVGNYFG